MLSTPLALMSCAESVSVRFLTSDDTCAASLVPVIRIVAVCDVRAPCSSTTS
jgi:hypothetical protein